MSKSNPIIEQAEFCHQLSGKLVSRIGLHENQRAAIAKNKGWTASHAFVAEVGSGITESGASKTQLQDQIIALRRELGILSKMLED